MKLFHLRKYVVSASIFLILSGGNLFAQMSEYDASPRMRSYLQPPVSQTEKYVEDVSAPSLSSGQRRGMGQELLPDQSIFDIPEVSEILIDKKIDPDVYIVGPGDLLNVYLWGELDKEFPIRISPEGFAIIPTIGEVPVAEMSLSEARSAILEKVHVQYEGIDVSIYLLEPRRFRVFISGVIENPGMYSAHSLLRVSDLLGDVIEQEEAEKTSIRMSSTDSFQRARGGLFARRQFLTIGEKKGSSKRAIIIKRGNESVEVDLLKFEKTGDLDSNPYIVGGDHIDVPPYMGDIAIIGEVNNEGIYEFKQGDRIADLLEFGGGLTAVADTSNALLVRFGIDGYSLENTQIDLYDAVFNNPDKPGYVLEESDRLFVQTKFRYKVLANVLVQGEVKYPGQYAIIPQETMLSELINMTGGFTENANLQEARIIRQVSSALRDLEYERLQLMLVADMSEDEYEYYKHRSRITEGIISIDFVKLFKQNDLSYDTYLEDEDNIFIPMKRELVNVIGAVREPGFIRVAEGRSLDYYLEQAGGLNWNARTRGTRIIKAKTSQRLRPGKSVIVEGGDTVLIPEKKPVDWWQSFQDGMQIFANVATIVIISRSLAK